MLQSQKKLTFKCYRGTLIQDPRKPCNSLPQCNKTERILQCFIIILDFFFENELHVNLRNLCKLVENVISRYLRGNCVASLGNLLLSEAS